MAKTSATPARKKKAVSAATPKHMDTSKKSANGTIDGNTERRVKVRGYKSFRLEKKVKRDSSTPLPSGYRMLRTTFGIIKRNWKVFIGIAAVYGVLTAALITGFSAVNLNDAKQSFGSLLGGQLNQAATGISLFVYLLGAAGGTASTPSASVYQVVLGVVISLAVIWTLRQIYAGNRVRIRDGFYQGMYPLVQFVAVLAVIGLQLIPLIAGAEIYQLVINNGIAVTLIEHILWLVLFGLLGLLSLYMVCASFFALYIVSLPDVTPLAALRAAKQLVLHRRWMVIRKVLFLPVALVAIIAIITVPIIMLATPIAPWTFFILSSFLLIVLHGYLYTLYKALL
jgi:hypothetical protein